MWSESSLISDSSSDDALVSIPEAEPSMPPLSARNEMQIVACHERLHEAHRQVSERLFLPRLHSRPASDVIGNDCSPHAIVFVPRSRPECAHAVSARDIDNVAVVAALAEHEWFVQETAIQTGIGPTGHLEVRLRAEWVIGPPEIKCAALRPRRDPSCIVSATAELPLGARRPRLLGCVICYDDAQISI